jgi:signal transduction histidine kinase
MRQTAAGKATHNQFLTCAEAPPPTRHLQGEDSMLHEFVTANRDAIIARTNARTATVLEPGRPRQAAGTPALPSATGEGGLPLFLTQLSERLRDEIISAPAATSAIGHSAARYGGELLALGYNVSEVVHHYGEVCQVITEFAVEQQAPITTREFHALNGCLDTAIAEAVTAHARVTAERGSASEVERLGRSAHELRNLLNSALLAFHTVQRGSGTVNGTAGMVLGRSLMGLRGMIDSALTQVRLAAGEPARVRLTVSEFIDEVAVVANLHAEYHDISFVVAPVGRELTVEADPQLLASAVMNLLTNAFKFSRPGGRVLLQAYAQDGRALIQVEDTCGGFPEGGGDPFRPFAEKCGRDRTGLGLGLSIARQAMRAHGGDIHTRNLPGKGCVFVAELPLAAREAPVVSQAESA